MADPISAANQNQLTGVRLRARSGSQQWNATRLPLRKSSPVSTVSSAMQAVGVREVQASFAVGLIATFEAEERLVEAPAKER
jgi:hypothetical protein